jgi:hypothetical protein
MAMKIFALAAVCLIASVAMGSVAYSPSVDVSVVPSVQTVTVGSVFAVNVRLHFTQPIGPDNWFHTQMLLNFDDTKLQLLGADSPASITTFDLFGFEIPEYVWRSPTIATFGAGDELILPAMRFRALALTDSTPIEISGPVIDENFNFHEAVKHNCDIDYTNNITGATVSVTPVPEPITLVAAFMGLSGLGCYVRRRSNVKA